MAENKVLKSSVCTASQLYVHTIFNLVPHFCKRVCSYCCCYATYQEPRETHESALSNSARFDCYR